MTHLVRENPRRFLFQSQHVRRNSVQESSQRKDAKPILRPELRSKCG
jgi:hypothetical protein